MKRQLINHTAYPDVNDNSFKSTNCAYSLLLARVLALHNNINDIKDGLCFYHGCQYSKSKLLCHSPRT